MLFWLFSPLTSILKTFEQLIMNKSDGEIYDYEARKLILQLINFIGTSNIDRCLENYNKSLVSAGPIYKKYYLKSRHPWWESFKYFFELERTGKSIKHNLDGRLKQLAGDAKKISILQQNMPEKVKNKYKRDLVDKNRTYDYLFELEIAWHYHLQGYEIKWYEEDGCPEFLVKTPKFDFNVECKRISVDGSRKIRRSDFYRLIEILLPQIEAKNLKGTIEIELEDRLHGNNHYLETLSSQVLDAINAEIVGAFRISYGQLVLNLTQKDDKIVDLENKYKELWVKKPHEAHGAIFAKGKNGNPINPLELIIKSCKADKVLDGIKRKIQKAISDQLPSSKPGLITCFLEDISDLNQLASGSDLQSMSCYILDKQDNSHVAAISYCSEKRILKSENVDNYNFQGLLFRNPNCSFLEVKDFPFLSKEIEL